LNRYECIYWKRFGMFGHPGFGFLIRTWLCYHSLYIYVLGNFPDQPNSVFICFT
jgi:hypothetical protein